MEQKKISVGASERDEVLRAAWRTLVGSEAGIDAKRLVFVEEMGTNISLLGGHRLLGSARIATGDRIEPERSAWPQNMHFDLRRELGRVAAKLRYGVSE